MLGETQQGKRNPKKTQGGVHYTLCLMDERKGTHNKVTIYSRGSNSTKGSCTCFDLYEGGGGDNLKATILQLYKEREELEEKFDQTTCEKNQLEKDLNLALEQLKKSEEMNRVEEDKKEKAYVDLRVICSSLNIHKDELDIAWCQRDE